MEEENMEAGVEEEVICHTCGGKHAGSCQVRKIFAALWLRSKQFWQGATSWSIADTTAGLLKLYRRHAQEGAADTITGVVVRDRAQLREMLDRLRWASAAYEKDRPTLVATLQLADRDVVRMVVESGYNRPGYFIARFHAKKHVVMSIRGTDNAIDILTDLSAKNEPFLQGTAHSGMLRAAKWLLETEGPLLTRLLAENPEYMLVLTGHSLGAAVATLLSMILHSTGLGCDFQARPGIHPSRITCWGFGCAPCVDRSLAETAESCVRNVVLQDDVVPRLTLAAVEGLRDEIQDTSMLQILKDWKKKKVVETMEQVNCSSSVRATREVRSSVTEKLQEACVQHGPVEGDSNSNRMEDESISPRSRDSSETDASSASIASGVMAAIATGSPASKHELEARRFYVPGLLYHIRRQKIARKDRKHNAGSKYKLFVVRGTDPATRFGRIVLSKRFVFDHNLSSIRGGILGAMQSC